MFDQFNLTHDVVCEKEILIVFIQNVGNNCFFSRFAKTYLSNKPEVSGIIVRAC